MLTSLVLVAALSTTPATPDFLKCRYDQMKLENTGQAEKTIGAWMLYSGVSMAAIGMVLGFVSYHNRTNFLISSSILGTGFAASLGGGMLKAVGVKTVAKANRMCTSYNY